MYHFVDDPEDVNDGDFRSEHPYATAAIAVTLVGVGSVVILPAVTVGVLAIVGFGPAGVAAG